MKRIHKITHLHLNGHYSKSTALIRVRYVVII
jgi:hypothetical protein